MPFELQPVLDLMQDLYEQPRSGGRFQDYLANLQGNTKGDMALPIAGFNPMAKDHILQKIAALKALNAEAIMADTLSDFNSRITGNLSRAIQVVPNLADDLKGGWTNHYTTDFASKFQLNALVSRNFCTPYFWSSESYTEALIRSRTLQYASRTLYWLQHERPKTLADFVAQEVFVCQQGGHQSPLRKEDFQEIAAFYQANQAADDYNLLFCFFYGDEAAASLAYPTFGITEQTGFAYAQLLAQHP